MYRRRRGQGNCHLRSGYPVPRRRRRQCRTTAPACPLCFCLPIHTLRAHFGLIFVRKCECPKTTLKRGIFCMGKKHKKPVAIQILYERAGAFSAWERTWSSSLILPRPIYPSPTSSSPPQGETSPPEPPPLPTTSRGLMTSPLSLPLPDFQDR